MADNPFLKPEAAPVNQPETVPVDRALVALAEPEVISGANWFWWIAGLSVVNTVMIHSGSDRTFVIGHGSR